MNAIADQAAAAAARQDLLEFAQRMDGSFTTPAHIRAIASQLRRIESREIRKLICLLPPRHGKTRIGQMFAAWVLGRRPSSKIILTSYAQEYSDLLSRAVRQIVTDDRYPWPHKLATDTASVTNWALEKSGGGLFSVGVRGSVTGRGFDLGIVDDAQAAPLDNSAVSDTEVAWSWWTTVYQTRQEKNAAIVVFATRYGEDDLVGRILAAPDAKKWTVLTLPAEALEDDPLGRAIGEPLWREMHDLPVLRERRVAMGDAAYEPQYQQRPYAASGAIFKRSHFENYYESPPERDAMDIVVISCDPSAGKQDPSAIVVIGKHKGQLYLLDCWAEAVEFPQLCSKLVELDAKWSASSILVEAASSGYAVAQLLGQQSDLPITGVPPGQLNKEARAWGITALLDSGKVLVPVGSPPWLSDLVHECLSFPGGRHDDRVDALSLALNAIRKHRPLVFGAISTENWRHPDVHYR